MKHVPRPMLMSYGPNDRNFPGLDRIFPEEKIRGENPVSSLAGGRGATLPDRPPGPTLGASVGSQSPTTGRVRPTSQGSAGKAGELALSAPALSGAPLSDRPHSGLRSAAIARPRADKPRACSWTGRGPASQRPGGNRRARSAPPRQVARAQDLGRRQGSG